MLMGAYIFLGSEALIPQLTANVSAVGSAVTMIRSRSILVNRGWIKKCQVTISPVLVEFITVYFLLAIILGLISCWESCSVLSHLIKFEMLQTPRSELQSGDLKSIQSTMQVQDLRSSQPPCSFVEACCVVFFIASPGSQQ